MNLGAALIGITTAFVLKVLVLGLSAKLLYEAFRGLWEGKGRKELALADAMPRIPGRFVKAGLVLFMLGEVGCGIEIYLLWRPSELLKILHSMVSPLAVGCLLYGISLYFDQRVLHALGESEAPCALQGICGVCKRRGGERCQYQPVFFWSMLLLAVAFLPLFYIRVRTLVADPADHVLPFPALNHWYDTVWAPWIERFLPGCATYRLRFEYPPVMTAVEFRWLPVLGFISSLGAATLSFVRRRDSLSLGLACLAGGALSYCYVEAALFEILPYPYLSAFGHELVEVLGLVSIRAFMNGTFRNALREDLPRPPLSGLLKNVY